MRAFIGIPFKQEVIEYLEEIKVDALSHASKSNPSRKENFHLTLLFLGEIDYYQQNDIEDSLDVTSNEEKFEIVLGKVGTFTRGKESILWVGVSQGVNYLNSLHNKVVKCVNDTGFDFKQTSFKPHITLARRVVFDDGFNIKDIKTKPIVVKVDRIHLYESHRVNGVLTYTPRKTIYLK